MRHAPEVRRDGRRNRLRRCDRCARWKRESHCFPGNGRTCAACLRRPPGTLGPETGSREDPPRVRAMLEPRIAAARALKAAACGRNLTDEEIDRAIRESAETGQVTPKLGILAGRPIRAGGTTG